MQISIKDKSKHGVLIDVYSVDEEGYLENICTHKDIRERVVTDYFPTQYEVDTNTDRDVYYTTRFCNDCGEYLYD